MLAVQNGKEKEIMSADQLESEKEKEDNASVSNRLSDRLSNSSSTSSTDSHKENKSRNRELPPTQPFIQNNINIPKFFFPYGKPSSNEDSEVVLQRVSKEFADCEEGKAYKHHMPGIVKVCTFLIYVRHLFVTRLK